MPDNRKMPMKLAAVIYAGSLSPHALEPIGGGPSAYERCLDFVRRLPGLERAVVAEGSCALPEGESSPKDSRHESWTLDLLLAEMATVGRGRGRRPPRLGATSPSSTRALAAKMLEDFRRYRAEYGFADGYPVGLAAEILAPRAVPAIRSLAPRLAGPRSGATPSSRPFRRTSTPSTSRPTSRPSISATCRLTLACDTKRNSLLVERLAAAGVTRRRRAPSRSSPRTWASCGPCRPSSRSRWPSGCPQACKLCAYPRLRRATSSRLRRDMPRERFAALLDQVVELCERRRHRHLALGRAEHARRHRRHHRRGRCAALALPHRRDLRHRLGPRPSWRASRALRARLRAASTGWSPSTPASPELYAELRGEGYRGGHRLRRAPHRALPRSAPMCRWCAPGRTRPSSRPSGAAGRRRPTRSSCRSTRASPASCPSARSPTSRPSSRRPCWHLKRDLSILVDGTVPLCRDFSHGDIILGNAFEARGGRPRG